MPTPITHGPASLRGFGFGGASSTSYVTGLFPTAAGTSAVLSGLGVQPGDFALEASISGTSISSAGGAWTALGSDGFSTANYRVLNATDVASGVTYSADCVIMFWRGGVRSAARRGTGLFSGVNPVAITGFNKAVNNAGLAAFSYAQDTGGGSLGTPNITTPATFAVRGSQTILTNTYRSTGYDRLTPPNAVYVDGTAFSATFNSNLGGYSIFELLR